MAPADNLAMLWSVILWNIPFESDPLPCNMENNISDEILKHWMCIFKLRWLINFLINK